MENKLFIYIDDNPLHAYPVVNGAVYSEEFNETIDSFKVVIDGVSDDDFVNLDVPYHIVKIVNKGTNGITWKGNNYIFMYVDTTTIEKKNIHDNIFSYTLELMNIVKVLENIQCPNLAITHDLVSGQTHSIYDYINRYLSLYCPKIKVGSDGYWHYEYLFNWNNLDVPPLNNTIVADLQVNELTLRQLLTTLMLQVDCIPSIDYRSIGVINFRDPPSQFVADDNGVNHFSLSNASDSYINTIVQSPSKILDDDNTITELVGFRNNSEPVLRQTANLQLQTRFPIYKIDNVKLYYTPRQKIRFKGYHLYQEYNESTQNVVYIGSCMRTNFLGRNLVFPRDFSSFWNIGDWNFFYPKIFTAHDSNYRYLHLEFCFNKDNLATANFDKIFTGLKIHLCKRNGYEYEEHSVIDVNQSWTLSALNKTECRARKMLPDGTLGSEEYWDNYTSHPANTSVYGLVYNFYIDILLGNFTNFDIVNYMWIEYYYDGELCFMPVMKIVEITDTTNSFTNYQVADDIYGSLTHTLLTGWQSNIITTASNTLLTKENIFNDASNPVQFLITSKMPNYADITPLFVEKAKRQLLKTDYTTMGSASTLNEFAEYYYATLQYTIGSNIIDGFSETYSYVANIGDWDVTKSYFDNIIDFINSHRLNSQQYYSYNESCFKKYSRLNGNMICNINTIDIYRHNIPSSANATNKATFEFEITYHPLNTFKMKWSKGVDFAYPIERLNNTESGLDNFSRFSKKAKSMVDRFGNAILSITQTTDKFADIQPVNSKYDDYIIFKRQITIERNYFNVVYFASKKYVMQNYFTSIITKYRAYQYVSYNESIERKDNKTIYCLIAKGYSFDGDDHIKAYQLTDFVNGVFNYDNNLYTNIKYLFETSFNADNNSETCKSDISILPYDNGFAIVNYGYDNVSAGVYLPTAEIDSAYGIGGILQSWQEWNQNSYNDYHYMTYIYDYFYIEKLTPDTTSISESYLLVGDYHKKLGKLPIIDTANLSTNKAISLYSDKSANDPYIFYKDLAERLNFTLQFEYYTNDDDIKWTKNFFKNLSLVNQIKIKPNGVYSCNGFDLYENATSDDSRTLLTDDISDYIEIGMDANLEHPYIRVKWDLINSNINYIVISNYSDSKYTDFMAFKRYSHNATYYLSFNDSKTNKVWVFITTGDNAGLYNEFMCSQGDFRAYEEII